MSLRKFSFFGSSSVINGPRPPTYAKKPVATPTYSRSVFDRTAAAGNGSFASTWSIGSPDSDSVFDQPADTDSSIMGTSVDNAGSVDITKPPGPRYGEFQAVLFITHSKIRFLSLLQIVHRGRSNSFYQPCLLR